MTPEEMFKKDQEIMTAVILKAMQNGWVPRLDIPEVQWAYVAGQFSVKAKIWNGEKMVDEISTCSIERIIFDHEFAKALWGEKNPAGGVYGWTQAIQDLSISEDRLEFLSKFI
jgi:hypothetical protein